MMAPFGSRPAARSGRQPAAAAHLRHSARQLLRTCQSPPNPCGFRPSRVASDGKVQVKGCSWLTPARSPPRWGFKGPASRSFGVSLSCGFRCGFSFSVKDTGTGRCPAKGTLRRLTPPFALARSSLLCAAASTPPLSCHLIPRTGLFSRSKTPRAA